MIRLREISKCFNHGTPRELQILDKVDIELANGELTVLLGGNGSGKTTLLRMITGDIQPDRGSIFFDDTDVTGWPAFRRASLVAHVQQGRERNLASNLTVAETFALAMSRQGKFAGFLRESRVRAQICATLENAMPGLEQRIDDQISSLSGGEHQIITILIAAEMVKDGSQAEGAILLDEHVAHLDPEMSEVVLQLSETLCRQYHLTTLMVTHDIGVASRFGDRILILKDRQICFDHKYDKGSIRNPVELLKMVMCSSNRQFFDF